MAVASMLAPGDFETQQAAIERKRKLIDLLAQQTSNPQGQMISGHYVAPNALQQLADLGGSALQTFGGKALDEQAAKANSDYQLGLGEAVKKYMDTRQGTEKPTTMTQVTPDGSVGAPVMESTPGNPRQAMLDAITSQYKPMQQLGMGELTQMGKQVLTQKDIFALAGENLSLIHI